MTMTQWDASVRRTYVLSGAGLLIVGIAAVTILIVTGHEKTVTSFGALISPVVSGLWIIATNYFGQKFIHKTVDSTNAQVASIGNTVETVQTQTNGLLSRGLEATVTKVLSDPQVQDQLASRLAVHLAASVSAAPPITGRVNT